MWVHCSLLSPCSLWPKDLFTIIHRYTVAVFRHTKRSHYGWLWATLRLLGFELRTFGRVVSALTHWTISSAVLVCFITAAFQELSGSVSLCSLHHEALLYLRSGNNGGKLPLTRNLCNSEPKLNLSFLQLIFSGILLQEWKQCILTECLAKSLLTICWLVLASNLFC